MKKFIAALCISAMLALTACGHPLETPTKTYPTYGYLNVDDNKSKNVCYEVSTGNIVWSVILSETIIAPVYFIGFDLFNPVSLKNAKGECGVDAK